MLNTSDVALYHLPNNRAVVAVNGARVIEFDVKDIELVGDQLSELGYQLALPWSVYLASCWQGVYNRIVPPAEAKAQVLAAVRDQGEVSLRQAVLGSLPWGDGKLMLGDAIEVVLVALEKEGLVERDGDVFREVSPV